MSHVNRNILRLGASSCSRSRTVPVKVRNRRGIDSRSWRRRVVGIRRRRAQSDRHRGRETDESVLPLNLARWDETARDTLVSAGVQGQSPARGAAGELAAVLSRLLRPARRCCCRRAAA